MYNHEGVCKRKIYSLKGNIGICFLHGETPEQTAERKGNEKERATKKKQKKNNRYEYLNHITQIQ